MLDITAIQALYVNKAVVFTQHFQARIDERGIFFTDVQAAVMSGDIIEQYPDDYPYPSALILRYSDGKPLHVVTGAGYNKDWLITAYFQTFAQWENDYNTRKAVSA
jgi:hypothetical protein